MALNSSTAKPALVEVICAPLGASWIPHSNTAYLELHLITPRQHKLCASKCCRLTLQSLFLAHFWPAIVRLQSNLNGAQVVDVDRLKEWEVNPEYRKCYIQQEGATFKALHWRMNVPLRLVANINLFP